MRRPRSGDLVWPLAPIGRHSKPLPRSRWLLVLADLVVSYALLRLLGHL